MASFKIENLKISLGQKITSKKNPNDTWTITGVGWGFLGSSYEDDVFERNTKTLLVNIHKIIQIDEDDEDVVDSDTYTYTNLLKKFNI